LDGEAGQASERNTAPGEEPDRLGQLEQLVDVLLAVALRGRLLPAERRLVKRHLERRKAEQRESRRRRVEREGPRCPACRLVIPDPAAERCPHCSVLLAVARRERSG